MSRMDEVERIFDHVVDLSAADRSRWLEEHYPDDVELRGLVDSLVSCDREGPDELSVNLAGASAHRNELPEIQGWELIESIGEGGMGRVYLAEDLGPLRRRAAIKILKRGLDTDEIVRRFESERRTLARMHHPGIATVYEAGVTDDGRPYVAMELVDGVPITEHCRRESLDLDARLELFGHVCEAVQHAHQKGIVHRDLKPSNIMLVDDGEGARVKVIDFGIAKVIDSGTDPERTRMGQILGTLNYMSPEQIEGGDVDVRTDVYALGLLLYTLVTDKPPYDVPDEKSHSLEAWRSVIVDGPTPRPSTTVVPKRDAQGVVRPDLGLRRDLDWIVLKALDKDPARRYASTAALADDVTRYRRREPIAARPPTLGYQLARFVDRHRGVVIATCLVFFSLIAGLVGSIWGYLEARDQARIASEKTEDAKDEAREARRSNLESGRVTAFLSELIKSAPGTPDGRETTLREAVDAAARQIDREFHKTPRVAALLHLAVGRAYAGLRRVDAARHHLTRAVDLNRPWLSGSAERTVIHRAACHGLTVIEIGAGAIDAAQRWIEIGLEPEAHAGDLEDEAARIALRSQLAHTLLLRGQEDEAEAMFREVIARSQLVAGWDNEVLEARDFLALLVQERGDHEEAEQLFRQSLEEIVAHFGPDHANAPQAYINHASSLRRLGRYDEAGQRYARAAEAARNAWGETSPELARALTGLAHLQRSAGERIRAKESYTEALGVMERVYGVGTPAAASVRNSLASLLTELGEFEAAEEVFSANRDAILSSGGEGGRQHVLHLQWLGGLRLSQGRLDDAEARLRESIDFTPTLRRSGSGFVNTVLRLAEVARLRGDLTMAREHLEQVATVLGFPNALEAPLESAIPATSWRCCLARVERDRGHRELAESIAWAAWNRLSNTAALSLRVQALLCVSEVSTGTSEAQLDREIDALIEVVRSCSGDRDPWLRQLEEAKARD